MHFFQPVSQIPVAEIIPGTQTSDETLSKIRSFAAQIGIIPITVSDTPGFFVNRVYASYISALLQLVEEKVDIERIDRLMEKLGWRSGPAIQADALGLDMLVMMLNRLHHEYPGRVINGQMPILQQCIDKQFMGRKTGNGFYTYDTEKKHKSSLLDSYYAEQYNDQISDKEIEQRLMFALCNETVRCLDEGVICSHQEADVALLYTLGFPRYLGGVFQYIDNMGLEHYLSLLSQYTALGELYQPPSGVVERIKNKQYFYHQPDIENEHIFN